MKIKTKFILFLVLVCFLHSCTKIEFEGPSIANIYGEFELIEPLKLTNKAPIFSSNEQVGFHFHDNRLEPCLCPYVYSYHQQELNQIIFVSY